MDPSGGESSIIGGVIAGEELGQRSAMQTPTSVLQSMLENFERLETKEKMEKEKETEKEKEKEKLMEIRRPGFDAMMKRLQESNERSKASRAMIQEMSRISKKDSMKAATKAKAKAQKGVASTKPEEGAEKAKEDAEEATGKGKASAEDIIRAKTEEAAKTIDLGHGDLEVKMDSSSGESSVELKAREELVMRSEMKVLTSVVATRSNLSQMKIKEEGEEYQQKEGDEEHLGRLHQSRYAEMTKMAQEAAVKMSKTKRTKKKAANKMKAMAEKAAWAETREIAMTTKASANEAAKIAKAKAEEAEEAAKIAKSKAEEAEEDVGVVEIAKLKAEEAEEAAKIAKSKAEEAEAAAEVAQSKADEAAKAKEAAAEVSRLKDKVTEWAQCEEELFAAKFRSFWNKLYTGVGATFQQTTFPAMRHTYPDSGCSTKAMETLLAISIKVTSIKECLQWPLEVFGMIAARDVLDHKRNIIFHRPRSNCQTITQDDRYLALTGPTRAIAVSTDPSYIEVSLKVKGKTKSEDKDLSEFVVMFRSGCCLQSGYPSRLSTLELEFGHIARSVEATVCIKIIDGSWPDGFRGAFSAGTSGREDLLVKLLDSGHDVLPVDADGVIKLSRCVVSIQLEKRLKVSVMACPIGEGHAAESSEAVLKPQRAGISPPGIKLSVGSCSMEVSVAWSCFRHEPC